MKLIFKLIQLIFTLFTQTLQQRVSFWLALNHFHLFFLNLFNFVLHLFYFLNVISIYNPYMRFINMVIFSTLICSIMIFIFWRIKFQNFIAYQFLPNTMNFFLLCNFLNIFSKENINHHDNQIHPKDPHFNIQPCHCLTHLVSKTSQL